MSPDTRKQMFSVGRVSMPVVIAVAQIFAACITVAFVWLVIRVSTAFYDVILQGQ